MKWFEKDLLCNIFALQRSLATNHEGRSSDYEMALSKKNGFFMFNNIKYRVKQHITFCT